MKIFDGSDNGTILKSLANVFNIDELELQDSIKRYYKINKYRLDNIGSYYYEFIEFLNINDYEERIQFDYIYFFHITSICDSLESIKKFGVLDLRELLVKETSFKKYLQKYCIRFELNDEIKLIQNGNKTKMSIFNSDECSDENYWKNYYGEYLYHRLNFDYNINGFLFSNNAYVDNNYFDLRNKSEFMDILGSFLNNKKICLEWQKHKKAYLLKCKIDVGQVTLGDGLTWPTKHQVSIGIIEKCLYYMVQLEKNSAELPLIVYVLINYGISIPFTDIEVISLKESG